MNAIAYRYGQALFALAQAQNLEDVIAKDLLAFQQALATSQSLGIALRQRRLQAALQGQVLADLAEKAGFSGVTKNFLLLVASHRRLMYLTSIIGQFQRFLREKAGEVVVYVTVARSLSPRDKKDLQRQMEVYLQKKVVLEITEDESILAGMRLRWGSFFIDDSYQTKLEKLYAVMKGA